MAIAYYAVIVLHILACLFLIGVVLLQQGKSQDLASAFGGGGTQTAFGPRGSANVLSRATTILAAVFMITSVALSILRPRGGSPLDDAAATQGTAASPSPGAPPASAAPGATATIPPAAAPSAAPASAPAASPAPR
jgi:preprotein translocase subunit SecG